MAGKNFEVSINTDDLELALKRVPKLLAIATRARLERHGRFFERTIDDVFTATLSGEWKINKTKDKLANRSGSLRRSFAAQVFQGTAAQGAAGLTLRATIGNARTAHYVFTQENGDKDRRSSTGKMLTIPAPANLTATGRARFTSPSQVEGLFFMQAKSGIGMLVREKGEGIEVLWILKRSVTIKPRLGFVRRWNSKPVKTDRLKQMALAVSETLTKAKLK